MRSALFVAIVSVVAMTSPVLAEEQRAVAVTGHGEVEVEPDLATVQLGVFVFDLDLLKAKKEADSKVANLLATFKRLDVKAGDIRTTQLHVRPNYKTIDDNWQLVGYEITRSMTVTIREMGRLNEFLDQSIEAGANRLEDISLSSSKEDELAQQVLTQAIENAKRRATRLAEGFGAKVGKVMTIEAENGSDDVRYNRLFDGPAFGEGTYHPGKIKIYSDIDVVFELTD